MGALHYRADIDGLRAVAVLAVLLFHLGFERFAGGFVGVDVFFVISGYLITRLIREDLAAGTFSLGQFYLRRFRRLYPALLFTLVVTFGLGAFILSPQYMQSLAVSTLASLFSVSNLLFWAESGYFDADAITKPLLHTWSLGVEEQFYLFWPALMLLLARLPWRNAMLVGIATASLATLGASQLWLQVDPAAAFFLVPFRVFEFGVGALLAWFPRVSRWGGMREAACLTGLATIVFAVATFDESTPFPGLAALVPVAGTALVIASGNPPWSGKLIANALAAYVGRISYSIYLVHWPLIVFFAYLNVSAPALHEQILLLLSSVGLAALMQRYVETPFRKPRNSAGDNRVFVAVSLSLTTLVAAVSFHSWQAQGWAWRMKSSLSVDAINEGKSQRFSDVSRSCRIERFFDGARCHPEREVQVLVIGNSHEPDGFNMLHAVYEGRADVNLVTYGTTNLCPLSERESAASKRNVCARRYEQLRNPAFLSTLDAVVFSSNRPFADVHRESYNWLAELAATYPGVRLVVIGGYINTRQECAELLNRTGSTRACRQPEFVESFESTPPVAPLYAEFREQIDVYVDKVALLCPDGALRSCATETPDGIPMFYDKHHLSLPFARWIGELARERYPDLAMRLPGADS